MRLEAAKYLYDLQNALRGAGAQLSRHNAARRWRGSQIIAFRDILIHS